MIEVTAMQVTIIGFIAGLIVQGIRLWKATTGGGFSDLTLTIMLFLVSLVLAWFWTVPVIPVIPVGGDIVGWLGTVIATVSALVGFATLVYNILLKAVLDDSIAMVMAKAQMKKIGEKKVVVEKKAAVKK